MTGLFGPANPVTYAEIAKMGLELAGEDSSSVTALPKNISARGQWSEHYIRLAEDRGLSVFGSSLNVNMAAPRGAVIQTILEVMDIPILHDDQNPYTDLPNTHPYRDAILSATALGIVKGDTDAEGRPLLRFRADDSVNRAEVTKILSEAGKQGCE